MPVMVNTRSLGVETNGSFDDSNTIPIPGGRLWPEAAVTWMAMRHDALREGIPEHEFMPAGPDSSARSRKAQDFFWSNRPPAAARPYTSNHGWGLAVDVAGDRAMAWILQHGHRYGWSHDEGARVGEKWHYRYVGAHKRTVKRCMSRFGPDPLASLPPVEQTMCREYDELKKADADRPRRVALREQMRKRRKQIWRAAEAEPEGWDRLNRRHRYEQLNKRTR